jgi:D-alanine transaminase
MDIIFLNGEYLPSDKAYISPMDRGYLLGDGVYEVIPVYGSKPFRLEQHLERLYKSLSAIQLNVSIDWRSVLHELIERNQAREEQAIYLQITRGISSKRELVFPINAKPNLFAYCFQPEKLNIATMQQGFKAITVPDIRWQYCQIKSTNLLANAMARQQAYLAGADEAIFIYNGEAVEASSSNLFIIKSGLLITPHCSNRILHGVTRDFILELAAKHHIAHQEQPILMNDLLSSDEVWLTSTVDT